MKTFFYWFRWLLVVPVFILGGGLGAAFRSTMILYYFPGTVRYRLLNLLFDLSVSSFAAVFLSTYVAPDRKRLLGLVFAGYLIVLGTTLGVPNPDQDAYPESRLIVFGSYMFGTAAALVLSRLCSRESNWNGRVANLELSNHQNGH
jgi:hypothetical protein